MRRTLKITAAILASAAMMASSTATAAAVPATAVSLHQVSPWAILAATSGGAPAAALCGTATAAAQAPAGCVLPSVDAAAPPVAAGPPPPAYAAAAPAVVPGISGEIIPFFLWFALIAVALGTSGASGRPNSPP